MVSLKKNARTAATIVIAKKIQKIISKPPDIVGATILSPNCKKFVNGTDQKMSPYIFDPSSNPNVLIVNTENKAKWLPTQNSIKQTHIKYAVLLYLMYGMVRDSMKVIARTILYSFLKEKIS